MISFLKPVYLQSVYSGNDSQQVYMQHLPAHSRAFTTFTVTKDVANTTLIRSNHPQHRP